MSDSALPLPAIAPPERRIFEHMLYRASPFGTLATTLLIFVLLTGAFALAAAADHYPLLVHSRHGWTLNSGFWPAIVLSVLVTVALGMQRYARNRDAADNAALQAVIPDCREQESRMYDAVGFRRLRIATVIGALFGALPTFALIPAGVLARTPAVYVWFLLINTLTAVLFARGIAQSTRAAENWARSIDQGLIVDLLRIDSLNVIGRHGARSALIWFSVAAAILLFFVGNNMNALTLMVLLLAAAMGIWIFVRPMERVHRRIREAKHTELESIRCAIQQARALAPHDATAATRLQGLLAYEARIEHVREWPFDQPTVLRMAAYLLIPAIPWFGQAIAGYFVANFVRAPI